MITIKERMPWATFEHIDELEAGLPTLWINASLMKKSSCNRAVNQNLKGLRKKVTDERLVLGTAIHKFSEVTARGGSMQDAQSAAVHAAPKDKIEVVLKATNAAPKFPAVAVTKDGRLFLEYVFKIPLYVVTHDGRSFNLALFGTFDRGYLRGDALLLQDFKTSSSWKVDYIREKYQYEWQMAFYKWVLYEYGHLFFEMDMVARLRDFKLSSQIIAVQMTAKTVQWFPLDVQPYSQSIHEMVEETLSEKLRQILMIYMFDLTEPNGWATNSCQWCDYNVLCHAPPAMKSLIADSSYCTTEHGPNYGIATAA